MVSIINEKDISIFADFDGTISIQDTNELLISHFGSTQNQEIEELYQNNCIGTKEAMLRHFKSMNFSEEEYKNYLLQEVKLDPYFKLFHKKVKTKAVSFKIVSAGYVNTINLLLRNEGIIESAVFANRLHFTDNQIEVEFYHDINSCDMPFEVCGNCKISYLKNNLERYNIFIGDGLTDRCMAFKADLVFAKDGLADFCQKEDLKYIKYNNFKDVMNYLNF